MNSALSRGTCANVCVSINIDIMRMEQSADWTESPDKSTDSPWEQIPSHHQLLLVRLLNIEEVVFRPRPRPRPRRFPRAVSTAAVLSHIPAFVPHSQLGLRAQRNMVSVKSRERLYNVDFLGSADCIEQTEMC